MYFIYFSWWRKVVENPATLTPDVISTFPPYRHANVDGLFKSSVRLLSSFQMLVSFRAFQVSNLNY